uniref:CSON007069 protein n=1 Tax=Culicoides sonorensis TaxID=179676 RepID=A0A336M190_CULSO
MLCIKKTLIASQFLQTKGQNRHFWQWVTMIFNQLDFDRIKRHGPDRACTEWLLRNGASVKFTGEKNLYSDYNRLPSDDVKFTRKIKEIHAIDAGLNSSGFNHLRGLTDVDLVHIENCTYVDDKLILNLSHIRNSLKTLEIIGCKNITDEGLMHAKHLVHLEKFLAHDLPYVKDEKKVLDELSRALPNCKFNFKFQ